ncbi:MAG TPA: TIGR04372 family glycosyltransferase [Gammaproteobacteria bacterium]|nr:TIGR04372 family glycosyltransferase [Gammaproteobacteria bacterium]
MKTLTILTNKPQLLHFYLSTKWSKFKKLGLRWVFKEILIRSFKELGWLLLLPLGICLHLLNFRRVPILIQHIGHLTSEPDTFLKGQALGFIPKRRYFILAPTQRTANRHLIQYWRKHLTIFSNPLLCLFLEMATRRYFAHYKSEFHQFNVFGGTQGVYHMNKLWDQRPPVIKLTASDESWGRERFIELGIPEGKWFVCLHVREGGFLPQNEPLHDFRNAKVLNTQLALEEINRRGGIVVRVGDASMSPLTLPGVIDYVHHPLKSDRMDVLLCAKARFFLGCSSGLAFLSMIFGIPIAHANMIPVDTLGFRYCDLSIPKRIWSHAQGRYLRFSELFNSKDGSHIVSQQYRDAGLRPDENTPEDILDLTLEMLDRLEASFKSSQEDEELHQRYLSFLKPGHYSYGAGSRVGLAFLRKNSELW